MKKRTLKNCDFKMGMGNGEVLQFHLISTSLKCSRKPPKKKKLNEAYEMKWTTPISTFITTTCTKLVCNCNTVSGFFPLPSTFLLLVSNPVIVPQENANPQGLDPESLSGR